MDRNFKIWQADLALDYPCELGEGPVWDQDSQSIWWVDILKMELHEYHTAFDIHKIVKVPYNPSCVVITNDGELLVAFNHRFAILDKVNGKILKKIDMPLTKNDIRFNDGKCDSSGKFWAGTISNTRDGKLWCMGNDYNVTVKLNNIGVSNGLAWSGDDLIFYYIDTITQSVTAYNIDAEGILTEKGIVIRIHKEEGKPDGLTIDSEGMLWVALWDGGKVNRYNPFTGDLLGSVILPVSKVTSCVFGGLQLDELYITTAYSGLNNHERVLQPHAGKLFVVKNMGIKGMPSEKFRN